MEATYVNNLVKQVKFAGFGDTKELEIRNRIAGNEPSFSIPFSPDFKNKCEASANIKKNDTKDDYYFNSYDVMVKKEGMEPIQQRVYVERPQQDKAGDWVNSTITLKEAYNMMDIDQNGNGRAVLKDFLTKDNERYQAWIKFDFTTKDANGNYPLVKTPTFDLAAKLSDSNIKDIQQPEVLARIKASLEKGNETNVREVYKDSEVVKGIQVNPQFKNFKFVTPFTSSRDQEQKSSQASDMSQTARNTTTQDQSTNQNNKAHRGQDARQDKAPGQKKGRGIRA